MYTHTTRLLQTSYIYNEKERTVCLFFEKFVIHCHGKLYVYVLKIYEKCFRLMTEMNLLNIANLLFLIY